MTKSIKERWRQFAAWVNGADSDTPVVTPEEKRAARPHPLRFLHGMLSEKNEMRVYHIFSVVMCLVFTGTLLLTVLGVLAGLAPASRAMHIKPVDAMRDE